MSIDFIRDRVGSASLAKAVRQQRQLRYFTQSEIQEDISISYLNSIVEKNYRHDADFLNWVSLVFRKENFLSFYKYYREPNAAAELINDVIYPALKRVFHSEDSYFKYVIKGVDDDEPESLKSEEFNALIFDAILFTYNDILITDLKGVNDPYRFLVSIDKVVAIKSNDSIIEKIAYAACVEIDGIERHGYVYIDSNVYAFYDKELKTADPILVIPHDLGRCPADYIVPQKFRDDDVVRRSLFSYIREKLEEYVFIKTLQKLTEPNGAFPVTTTPKQTKHRLTQDKIDTPMPMSSGQLPNNSDSPLQAATLIEVPVGTGDDGKMDMNAVSEFFKFFYVPVEILDYLNKRIIQIENDVILRILGDNKETNEKAFNEMQVAKGYVNKADRLREISGILTRIRKISDTKMLEMKHGRDSVKVDVFYGSDFFQDTEMELYDMLEKSPNTLERMNLLKKLSSIRNKFNREKASRESILYDLIPFVSDKDFELAKDSIDSITMSYQTRFNYWISQFEAEYGDILSFWDSMGDSGSSEKLKNIDNLVKNIIKDYDQTNSTL